MHNKIDLRIGPAADTLNDLLKANSLAAGLCFAAARVHGMQTAAMQLAKLTTLIRMLWGMQSEGEGSIDFGFIDANKEQYDEYYEKLLLLLRPGGMIVVDNVLWDCRVLDPNPQEQSTKVGAAAVLLIVAYCHWHRSDVAP